MELTWLRLVASWHLNLISQILNLIPQTQNLVPQTLKPPAPPPPHLYVASVRFPFASSGLLWLRMATLLGTSSSCNAMVHCTATVKMGMALSMLST